jgi:hypothetical protein
MCIIHENVSGINTNITNEIRMTGEDVYWGSDWLKN